MSWPTVSPSRKTAGDRSSAELRLATDGLFTLGNSLPTTLTAGLRRNAGDDTDAPPLLDAKALQ
jgi:hypothetical protein